MLVDDNSQDPKNWAEAMKSKDKERWKQGMDKEMEAMVDRKVWKLVPPSEVPKEWKVVGCRPVCHIKRNSEGKVMDHKVCLVTQGFSQVAGWTTQTPSCRLLEWRACA
jgi:hypothetical protein